MHDSKTKIEICPHKKWKPHFHELIDKTPKTMRVGVCVMCEECGMLRTKVLEFRFPEQIEAI